MTTTRLTIKRLTGNSLIALILFVLITSCNDNRIYDEVKKIPSGEWSANDSFSFMVNVSDTTKAYDIYLHIRNSNDYEYSNIWLFVDTESPNGAEMRDTIEFVLCDASGSWYGKGLGNIYTSLISYKQNIRFPYRGIYSFTITQGMRREQIHGIKDIGLRVQER